MMNDTYGYDSGPDAFAAGSLAVVAVFYIAIAAFGVYLYMRIARKAGWSLWHGLLVLVPLLNLVVIIMFAFTEWPIERRLREAEARLGMTSGGTPYGYPGASAGYGTTPYGATPYGTTPYGGPSTTDPYGTDPSSNPYGTPEPPR